MNLINRCISDALELDSALNRCREVASDVGLCSDEIAERAKTKSVDAGIPLLDAISCELQELIK